MGINLSEIIFSLKQVAELLELEGENIFKVRAWSQAAALLEAQTPQPTIAELIKNLSEKKLKGFGPALTENILSLIETGKMPYLVELAKQYTPEIKELMRLKGLGPKKIKLLISELCIQNIEDLEQACKKNLVQKLKGFSEKSEAELLTNIAMLKENRGKLLISEACSIATAIETVFKNKNFDLLPIGELESRETTYTKLEFATDLKLDALETLLQELPELNFKTKSASALQYALSSQTPVVFYSLSAQEYLTRKSKAQKLEEELKPLVQVQDLRGILHVHSIYSDGEDSLVSLAAYLAQQGYQYLGISDHSKSAAYAGGLAEARVQAQHREIEKLNAANRDFKIFKGIESDILADGSLDYSDQFLKNFDFVIASVHSRFNLAKTEMTARLIRAIEHPATTILGHPTGRLLLEREGYQIDLDKIIDACIANKVVIEINSNPRRLDLDWSFAKRGLERGLILAICPDAHALNQITHVRWGIAMAQKAGATAEQILNTFDCARIGKYFQDKS